LVKNFGSTAGRNRKRKGQETPENLGRWEWGWVKAALPNNPTRRLYGTEE